MSFDTYRAIDAMNWSTLKAGAKSMRHLHHAIITTDDGDTSSRAILRLNHAAVLEPHTLDQDFVVWTGGNRVGKDWLAFKAAHEGRQIVKSDEMDAARRIATAIRANPTARDMLDGALTEHTIEWTDAETGVKCKARMDVYKPGSHIADVKGDASVQDYAFARRVGANLYYAQAAWYQMGVESTTGERLPYYLMPYETAEPHDCAVFEVDEDWLAPGRELCRRLLREYVAARDSGVWPGRYSGVMTLPSPPRHINPDVADFEFGEES